MNDVILVVDDNPQNLQLLSTILSPLYQIILADTGEKALKFADSKLPDLILLDIMLPIMDGYEVCRQLKSKESTKYIPVIFMTAKVAEQDLIEAFEAGGIDYLTKPLKIKEMLVRIRTHLELADSRQRILSQNAELKELLARSDRFVSIIAHNLRSPFNGLLTLTQLLLEEKDEITPEERDKLIESIFKSAETSYMLVEDLLIWSRIQTGRLEYSPECIFLNTVISESEKKMKKLASEKKITIVDKNDEQQKVVFADGSMVSTILENLLSNAIKFSYSDSIIEIGTIDGGDQITVYVKDSGVGIHEKIQQNIFMIDKNISTFGTQEEKGSGIGLLICKELVEMNNGKIWFESKLNEGSVFYFSLNKLK